MQTRIVPTLQNGWVSYGGDAETCEYYKDEFGVVHVGGLVKSGMVGQPVFILPVGYRPQGQQGFNTVANRNSITVEIDVDGNVIALQDSNVWLSLANISFKAV